MISLAFITEFREIGQGLTGWTASVGIIVAAYWFFRRRQRHCRAVVTHTIIHRPLGEKRWVRLSLTIENKGDVLLPLEKITIWVFRGLPLEPDLAKRIKSTKSTSIDLYRGVGTDGEFQWPKISEREFKVSNNEIEPGESESFHFDFAIDIKITSIFLRSYNNNNTKRGIISKEIGWTVDSFCDFLERQPTSGIGQGPIRPTEGTT
jgi:hypothetical protein